ncbi:MAG TPA: DUF1318 domain-containing protein [Pinirhizobacter sp.]|uniref:DUF1318 domain-containing protein n=1 Tax=Pinirhizobacter sp. TaxID=2950432 RepID=UPI002C0ACD78|nr:DUF1318 domain-containing protein [Pinirhizobacter sp.]HMH69421.1 DUF1318 domain-containing protein [Pinirhizobacter sp.]
MRRTFTGAILALVLAVAGCVTINVYFPEAAAQKAADQFIGNILEDTQAPPKPAAPATDKSAVQPSASVLDLLIPAAYAADTPDIRVQTATTQAIGERMKARLRGGLKAMLDSGAVGLAAEGDLAVRDANAIALAQRAQASAWVAEDNRDRAALYREVANANGHPEWEGQVRATFARGWIERAPAGWYYRDAAGQWHRK